MRVILDRIEGKWAIIEHQGTLFQLPVSLLPKGVREGDSLSLQVKLDRKAAAVNKRRIQSLADKLFKDQE